MSNNTTNDEGNVKHVSEDQWGDILQNHDKVIVYFWATWCGPCRMFGPVFESVANKISNDKSSNDKLTNILFAKINIDDCQNLAQQYGIRQIPTLAFFQAGQHIDNRGASSDSKKVEDVIYEVYKLNA